MSSQIALNAFKTSEEAAVSTSLAVVASDVLGPGGIGDAWLVGGLNSSMTMACTSTAPSNCDGSTCSIVWLQPESDGCSIFNSSHIRVVMTELSLALAMLKVTGTTRGLREREYRFQLHVPAFNGSAWRWVSIRGTFDVRAVADAALSRIRLLLAASDDTVFGVVNHLDDLKVEVEAFDVDGNRVTRAGEQITIVIKDSAGNRTVPLQFNSIKRTYVATFPPLSREAGRLGRPGVHDVYLATPTTTGLVYRMHFSVVCVAGFTETDQSCVEAANDVEKIVGGTIGAVLLVVLVLGLGLLYKNRVHALRFALSFFQLEFLLVVKTMAELWDITSDRTRSAKPTVLCEHHQIVSILSYTWVRVGVRSVHLHDSSQEWIHRRHHRLHCLSPIRAARFGVLIRHERMAVPLAASQAARPARQCKRQSPSSAGHGTDSHNALSLSAADVGAADDALCAAPSATGAARPDERQ